MSKLLAIKLHLNIQSNTYNCSAFSISFKIPILLALTFQMFIDAFAP